MVLEALKRSAEFQSTHPCGVRHVTVRNVAVAVTVSIHAPLRGATGPYFFSVAAFISFNPRTPAGCDH